MFLTEESKPELNTELCSYVLGPFVCISAPAPVCQEKELYSQDIIHTKNFMNVHMLIHR